MDEDSPQVGPTSAGRSPRPSLAELRARRAKARTATTADVDEGAAEEESEVDDWCEEHGFEQHMLVHEAGHAVAALEEDIVFESIVLYGEGRTPKCTGRTSEGVAQVTFASKDNRTWASGDAAASLRFAMAGAYAEATVLNHEYPGSGDRDMIAWAQGVELPGGWSIDDADARLGCSHEDVDRDAAERAVHNSERIKRLAALLSDRRASAAPDEDVEVSYDEVKTFLSEYSTNS